MTNSYAGYSSKVLRSARFTRLRNKETTTYFVQLLAVILNAHELGLSNEIIGKHTVLVLNYDYVKIKYLKKESL